MNLANTYDEAPRSVQPTLRDAIAGVHNKLFDLTAELREARQKIASLKQELATNQPIPRAMPESNLSGLRRDVAFYCHPDRGGNDLLMRRLNVLFDFLRDTLDHPKR